MVQFCHGGKKETRRQHYVMLLAYVATAMLNLVVNRTPQFLYYFFKLYIRTCVPIIVRRQLVLKYKSPMPVTSIIFNMVQ